MNTVTATEAHGAVEKAATEPNRDLRMIEKIEIDQVVRQGDIYVQRIRKADVPKTAPYGTTQLAPGNTQGSRHIVKGSVDLRAPEKGADALKGPYILAKERFEVTHPEHAHFSLPPGTYRVTYQRDFAQEEIARVMD